MANNNQIELVVTVEVDKANQSIKSVNANLSGIEAAATKSARAASHGIDGMTASMAKGAAAGHLLAEAIHRVIEFAKEWTIEAAKEAAHQERAVAITRALAKSHGDGAAAAEKAIEAIRKVGYATAEATTNVQKLIIADIGLDKATSLAKIAKDAAAVNTEGLGASEAFEKLMLAIETGQSRGLRTMSLFPKMAEAEEIARLEAQLHGKTLSDLEVKQVRYNAIVEASKTIQGAAAEAAGTFDGQMKKLSREMKDLKEDVGKAFQGELMAAVSLLKGMVGFFKDHTDAIEKFGKGALVLVGIIATVTAATKAWALAQGALNLAMAVNPAFLLAGGIIGAGLIIYKEYSDMTEEMDRPYKEMENSALRKDVLSGKTKVEDLRKKGMTDDQIRELVSGRKMIPGEESPWGELGAGLPKIHIGTGKPDPEALRLAIEVQKRQRENAEYFKQQAIGAEGAGKTGFAKDVADMNPEIARRTTFTDDKGTHQVALTKSAWESIIDTMQKKLQAFKDHFALENRKALADYLKDEEEAAHRQLEWEAKRYQERLKNDVDISEKNIEHLRQVYAFEEQRAGFERDARLRQLEGVDAVTLQQKTAVEQQKAQIEIDYLQKVHEVKQALYDMDTRRLLLEEELTLKRLRYKADEIKARIAELTEQRQDIRAQGDEANDAAIQAARENAANRTTQLVRDHNRQIFESLKQQAGGVFDALLSKSQSVWKAIGNSFKTAILTAIKEVVTSRVAAMLMQMFTGQKISFAGGGAGPGGSGGVMGGLGGLLGVGAVPVFGSGGWTPGAQTPAGGMAFGGGMTQQQAAQVILGGGAAGAGAGGGGVTSKAGVGMLGNLKQSIAGWKDLLTSLGNIGFKPERWSIDEAGNMTKLANARGVGGMKGGAMLAAGAMLVMDGLRRGGKLGVAETTGGGALIGAKFGGPLGAAIGAIAGFAAGMVRLFIKGAQEKAREKIKNLYGVDISDKAILRQIVDAAKQSYGGNIDMAIRTEEIRDLIKLYAMSTGQPTRGMPATAHPLELAQSGGSLYQSPGYANGTALPGLGGLPSLDRIGGGVASAAGPVVIQLDGPATTSLLRGEAVQAISTNPRVVAGASLSAAKSNAGRRELTSLQLSPGLVTS